MESPEEAEYRNKLNAIVTTFGDQMAVLEARDRLMRCRRGRQTDLATAVAVVGTCPDMCPELERYFRIETNQVSNFELDSDGRPDEHRMIKEYRRSGADQEEPLAHELRPASVLINTMDYLCINIMDALDMNCNFGEWYDFVWSRSRSIRKDITQQHLCDTQSVALTEKCARFHIHCAATLCEQDVKDFDPKINEENLSNCLQSLKDFYYDLSLRGIYCDNECEFRCYEILLHLNDTSILRDVQNYRQPIRDSQAVKFAVKAFFAYHSNNYIQFFKLVNQSSYLMACVLHRYFISMRLKAFKILRKSYTSNSSSVQEYKSEVMIDCLGFEHFDELKQFCDHIGLECSDGIVLLIRGQNQNSVIKPKRSVRLIETKRKVSVGEIINGMPLPPNPYKSSPVHNSFGTDCKLKADAIDALDQFNKSNTLSQSDTHLVSKPQITTKLEFSATLFRPQTSVNAIPLKSKSFASNSLPFRLPNTLESSQTINSSYLMQNQKQSALQTEQIDSLCLLIGEELLDLVTKQLSTQICNEELKRIETIVAQQLVCKLFSELLLETTDYMIKEIAINVIKEENDRKVKERQQIEELTIEMCQQLANDLINCQIQVICQQMLSECQIEFNEKQNELIGNEILKELLTDMTESIASHILSEALEERQTIIRIINENRIKRLEHKYFAKWKQVFTRRKRFIYFTNSFPAAPKWLPTDTTTNTFHYNYSQQTFNDNFNKNTERELMANKFLYDCIDLIVKQIASNVIELSIHENGDIFDYLRQKRQKRLLLKYFQKWKSFCFERRRVLRRKAFPAAPNWAQNHSHLSQIEYSFSCLDSELKISPKRMRREEMPSIASNEPKHTSNSGSNLRHLLEQEMLESNAFTKNLNKTLSPLHSFNQTIEYSSDDQIDDQNPNEELEVIEVIESQTDKRERLNRLLAEERDYFSYHNFVQYLSQNYFSSDCNE